MKRLLTFGIISLSLVLQSCGKDSDNLLGPSNDGYIISGSFDIADSKPSGSSLEPLVYSISLNSEDWFLIKEEWREEKNVEIDSNGHFSIFISNEEFVYRLEVGFSMPIAGHVSMEVRDARGGMIKKLIDCFLSAGYYKVLVDLSDRININYITDEIRNFADKNWHYADAVDSKGDSLDYNYWKWLECQFLRAGLSVENIDPYNYAVIDSLIDDVLFRNIVTLPAWPHHLSSKKTPLYYVMIAYPQFIYGWEDIDDLDEKGNPINPTIVEYKKFDLPDIGYIKSPLRDEYCEMLRKALQAQ